MNRSTPYREDSASIDISASRPVSFGNTAHADANREEAVIATATTNQGIRFIPTNLSCRLRVCISALLPLKA